MESSAYLMLCVQFVTFISYFWWSRFVPASLFFPVLLLPVVIGLLLNGMTIRKNRKAILAWGITVWYVVFGGVATWDWMK